MKIRSAVGRVIGSLAMVMGGVLMVGAPNATAVGADNVAPSSLLAIDQNRATVIERIVSDWGAPLEHSNAGISSAQLREMLAGLRADHLLAASLAGSVGGLREVLANAIASSAPATSVKVAAKALGDANQDLVYTPQSPCRLFDTRASQGGLGTPTLGVRRTYGARAPVTSQGGPGGCVVPAGATVALIQIGTLGPSGSGILQGGPQGASSFPNALILYQAGDQYGTSVAMPLNPANGQFDLMEQFATADLYADLLGAFGPTTGFTGTITAAQITGTIGTSTIADGAVTASKLAANAVGSANIAPGSVGRAQVNSFEVQLRVAAMCPRGAPMLGILADGNPICDQPLRTLAFGSYRLSVGVRSDGRPIVSRDGGSLYDCDNVDCTTGTTRNVNIGSDTAMALRSDGFPVIAVGSSSNQFLVICNDATCTARTQRTLDTGSFGIFSGVALRADNSPVVVSFEYSSGITRLYACGDPTCASFATRNLTGGPSFTPSGVKIRPNGTPVVALRNYFGGGHGLYDCNDSTCSSGTIRGLGAGNSIRFLLGLAVRSDNRPMVVNTGPVLHDCNDAACSSVTNRPFDTGEGVSASAIAIRGDGRPLLFYATYLGDVKVFDCADTACNSGSARVIDQAPNAYFPDTELAVALRPDGRPVIAYIGGGGTVRLLLCSTTNCL